MSMCTYMSMDRLSVVHVYSLLSPTQSYRDPDSILACSDNAAKLGDFYLGFSSSGVSLDVSWPLASTCKHFITIFVGPQLDLLF